MTTLREKQYALMEAHEIEAADKYFSARPYLDSDRKRRIFEAGFKAAWSAALVAEQPCYCDKNGIGEPGVSCGDCPTRDYKKAQANQPQPGWKPIKTAPAQQCIVCGKPLGSAGDIHTCSPQVDQ